MHRSPTGDARLLFLAATAALVLGAVGCAPRMPPVEMGVLTGYDRLEAGPTPIGEFELEWQE